MVAFSYLCILIALCWTSLVSSVTITGPQGGVNPITGQRPARTCFTDFRHSGPAFDLYIQSLQQFQQQNQSALLSYYQVSGIHGRPFISWDGVQGSYYAGYCTHGSILFPTWHRPYLALFEQILWNNAQSIAASYPPSQRRRYQEAATTFRIPYWDWALNATMPDAVNQQRISINTPQGHKKLPNPLYSYTFHPQPSASEFPPSQSLSKYHTTVRYPDANGNSQPQKANQQLQANAQALHDLTYQLISSQSSYAPFSNTGYTDGRGGLYNSIENMHNAIHALVGQGGHMSIIPYSAFDPIFWLHHANVDRLIAMWQAIYPDSFTSPEATQYGTYTDAPGEIEDINTPLTPFHSDNSGTLYTSATARATRPFGYTYPEITDWGLNSTQIASNVRRNLNMLYNPDNSISSRSLTPHHRRSPLPPNSTAPNSTNSSTIHEYLINIRVSPTALAQSFFIHFFLGLPPASPSTWSFASNLIGSQTILHPSSSTNTNSNITTYGQLPINHALTSLTSNLTPQHIAPLLQPQLQWRIQTFDDTPVDASSAQLESLKIFVVGREVVREAGGDQFAEYGQLQLYRGVTEGKAGGLGAREGM